MKESWQRSMNSVRNFARKVRVERCDLCASEITSKHQHLLDPETRQIVCSCDGCAVLFDAGGTTKYRRVPRDVKILGDFPLTDDAWGKLLIPIGLGFIYRSSKNQAIVASYPSPAGVTETQIDAESWQEVVAANPMLADMRDDVEALLVNRLHGQRDYFLAPIDRCFELVGLVRAYWQGMSGGDRVWTEVNQYLSTLRESAKS